jgi:hypothetical protein
VGIAQPGVHDGTGGAATLALPVVRGLLAGLSARHRDRSHHPQGLRRAASPLESPASAPGVQLGQGQKDHSRGAGAGRCSRRDDQHGHRAIPRWSPAPGGHVCRACNSPARRRGPRPGSGRGEESDRVLPGGKGSCRHPGSGGRPVMDIRLGAPGQGQYTGGSGRRVDEVQHRVEHLDSRQRVVGELRRCPGTRPHRGCYLPGRPALTHPTSLPPACPSTTPPRPHAPLEIVLRPVPGGLAWITTRPAARGTAMMLW